VTTVGDLEGIYQDAVNARMARKIRRLQRPLVRLWDGDWNLRGICTAEIQADFKWLLNESGTGMIELPADHYLAKWIMDPASRDTQNVHITVDKDGARWSGRMKTATEKKTATGLLTVVVQFMHDYEEVKWMRVWSNPFLPAAFQFPRVFMLAAPSRWALKLALFLQIFRKESSIWSLPDDPLDPTGWLDLDMSTWSMVVAPSTFADDTSLWTVLSSRWAGWHEMAKDTLDDAQLMVTTRRWLTGDPPAWDGAPALRNGCLVFDIVDKSGYYTQSSGGGTVLNGLERTVLTIADDFIDETVDEITSPVDDSQYLVSNWLGTRPDQPWVVYREGTQTGIQTSEFTVSPATAVQIDCGGHSAPGVNEGVSATVQLAGDLLGATFMQSGIGSIADTVLKPLYVDTIAAWMSFKSPARAESLGWSHYFEYFQPGADKAYTLSSLVALRAGMYATRSFFSHKLTVSDGAPFMVGDNGQGHYFLGDRIGSTRASDPTGKIYVDQVTSLELAWRRGVAPAWQVTIGTNKALEEPTARALRYIQNIMGDLHDLGVM
jgi:hypothetical protein